MGLLLPIILSLISFKHIAAETFVVQVGGNTAPIPLNKDVHMDFPDPSFEWSMMKFYPSSIDINVGDTISFQQTWGQGDKFHTINFNPPVPQFPGGPLGPFFPVGGPPPENPANAFPPKSQFFLSPAILNQGTGSLDQRQRFVHNGNTTYIASGFFADGNSYNPNFSLWPSFNITFQAAGSWIGYCAVHSPGMTIIVNVHPANTAYPKSAQAIITEQRGMYDADTASAGWRNRHILRDETYLKPVPISDFPSGFQPQGAQYIVRVGNAFEGASQPRFSPDNIEISVGDVLHFYSEDYDVHTVTIHGPNNDFSTKDTSAAPNTTIFKDFPSTPGNLTNPFEFNGYAHSGLILNENLQQTPDYPPFFLKSPFSVRFNTVGTFHLMCLLHAPNGMEGRIVVKSNGSCAPQQASVVNINFAGMLAAPK